MASKCIRGCQCHDLSQGDKPPCYLCVIDECSEDAVQNNEIDMHLDPKANKQTHTHQDRSVKRIEITRGWHTRLGIVLKRDKKNRVFIHNILSGTLAARDGRLKVGDIVLKVDGQNLALLEMCQVYELLRQCKNKVVLTIKSGGKPK